MHILSDPLLFYCVDNCSTPEPPHNGSLMQFNYTLEELRVLFWCDNGFIPREHTLAVCQADGTWKPNPADTICISGMFLLLELQYCMKRLINIIS